MRWKKKDGESCNGLQTFLLLAALSVPFVTLFGHFDEGKTYVYASILQY